MVLFYVCCLVINIDLLHPRNTLAVSTLSDDITKECFHSNNELCGVCGHTSLETVEKCTYPFSYRYQVEDKSDGKCKPSPSEGSCNTIATHCKENTCKHGGTCHEGFGTYRCQCSDSHYGMRCQYERKKGELYAEGIQVFINSKVLVNTNASLIISTDVGGSNLLLMMESDMFQLNYVNVPVIKKTADDRQHFCKEHTGLGDSECSFIRNASDNVYIMNYLYPVINSTLGPFIYRGKEYPPIKTEDRIGYFDNITITAFQTKRPTDEELTFIDRVNQPVFYNVYPVFAYYLNGTFCMVLMGPPLGRENICTMSPGKRPIYPPYEAFTVAFTWDLFGGQHYCRLFLNNYTKLVIERQLTIRKVFPNYYEMNKLPLDIQLKKHKTNYDQLSYRFETGIISFEYRTVIDNNNFMSSTLDILYKNDALAGPNYYTCFVEIRRECLVPQINHGINQTVYANTEDGFVIDATKSTNMNRKDRKRSMKWSCTLGNTTTPCFTSYMYNDRADYFQFRKNVLEIGKTYNFTLTLYEDTYELTTVHAHYAVIVGTNRLIIRLSCPKCVSGIMANPRDENVLLVTHTGRKPKEGENEYVWQYREIDEPNYKSADGIRVNGTDETIFKINKRELDFYDTYEFYVSIKNKIDVFSKLIIKTPERHIKSCVIEPKEGIQAVTLFDMNCIVKPAEGVTYIYEFFDKDLYDDDLYSGRMIGTSNNGGLYQFRLTRGLVEMVSFDPYKVTEEVYLPVDLYAFNESVSYVDQLIKNLNPEATYSMTGIYNSRKSQSDIALTSAIADILTKDMDRNYVIGDLVRPLYRSEMFHISDVKMCLSSIRNILVTMYERLFEFTMKADVAKHCSDVILRITTDLVYRINHSDNEKSLSVTICHQLAGYVLDSVSVIVRDKNKEVLENIEEFVNPVILDLVQKTSNELVQSLDQISHMLLRLQIPGNTPVELVSLRKKITSWVNVGHPMAMSNITVSNKTFPLHISTNLSETMRKESYIGVQFILMNINPFWWAGGNIVTQVLFVVFCNKNNWLDYTKIYNLRYPMQLYYNITNSVNDIEAISGQTIQLSESMTPVEKDLALVVYRFDPPLRAKMFIKFLFEEQHGEYLVLFKNNLRPDSSDMYKDAVTINNINPVYNLTYEKNDQDNIYYMGILPVVPSSKYVASSFAFKLNIYYTKCNIWLKWQWTDRGCWVGERTNDKVLECECTHLSLFAGTVLTPQNNRFDFWDFDLFLTPQFNYLPITIMLITLMFYIIAFIWCIIIDGRDKTSSHIIILEDNYPGDPYGYLIAVYTGARITSGTSANVGIKLLGSEADSRSHILKSNTRRTLKTSSDDWFLIFCPCHLGELTCLHIWHDNTGKRPDWYLDKVKVFDLKEDLEYIFNVHEWIALALNRYPEVLIAPASLKDCFNNKQTFVDNILAEFRSSHYWTSVLWKHPRDPVARVHRLQVVLCFVMSAMAISILLYVARSSFSSGEDEPSYKLTSFDYWALIISCFTALTISCFTMCLFKNSFSYKYNRNRSSLFVYQAADVKLAPKEKLHSILTSNNSDGHFVEYNAIKPDKEKGTFQNLKPLIYKFLHPIPLAPVMLKQRQGGILVRKHFLVYVWFFCCIITMISCAVVVTFGWKIKPVHGYQWATIFFCILVIEIFIFSILKIVLTSAVFTLMFTKMISLDIYSLRQTDAIQTSKFGDSAYLDNLLRMRIHDMYVPLSYKMKDVYLTKVSRRIRWEIVLDFFIILLFLVVLAMVMTNFSSQLYPSNRHAKFMVSHGHSTSHPNLQEVFNRTHVEDFLLYNFLSQLYRFLWYNLDHLDEKKKQMHRLDWTDDCVVRLVGNAYFRQLRVVVGGCPLEVQDVDNRSMQCSPAWSRGREDRDRYYIGWKSVQHRRALMKSTAWRYTPPDGFSSSSVYGASAILYPAGGYIAHLGYNKRETQYVASKLIADSWLDHATRAVFVQLTLYNVNTNLFSHIILVAEQMPTGQYFPLAKVESMAIHFSYDLWNVSFSLFLIIFTVRTTILINKYGISNILSFYLHMYEIFLIVFGYSCVCVYFLHIYTSSEYVEKYQRKGINEFFSFVMISRYAYISQAMMCALFFLVVLRLMCSFRFGEIFLRHYYALYLSLNWLFWLTLCLILCLYVLWRMIGYLINVHIFHYYTSIIMHPKDVHVLNKQLPVSVCIKLLLVIMCTTNALTMVVFITAFSHYYKIAKYYKVIDVNFFNFAKFLGNEIKRVYSAARKYKK